MSTADLASVARVDALLAEYRRYYPDALAVSGGLVERRGEPGLEWPDWCWLPMAATVAYLTSRGVHGDRLGTDIGRVAALTQWRIGWGVVPTEPGGRRGLARSCRPAAAAARRCRGSP